MLKKILKIFLILIFVGIVAGGSYAGYCIYEAPKIKPQNIYNELDKSSTLYDGNRKAISTLYYGENRKIVTDIPDNVKNAFIAIEDKTFYKHHGINFKRMVGAVLSAVTNKSEISGTSTITQQLARNVYLSDTKSVRSIKRKITEVYYAFVIEKHLEKKDIIEAYLNTIYLGYGCYGIDSAAHTYFNKSVDRLNTAECAVLATLPQAPDSYALIKDEKGDNTVKKGKYYINTLCKDRRDMVLDLMVEQGMITEKEAQDAKKPIEQIVNPKSPSSDNEYTYFKDYVIDQVTKDLMSKYSMKEEDAEKFIYTGGLKIYSTIDPTVQKAINNEFSNDYNFPVVWSTGGRPQAAMVVMEVGTGEIKGMVGGRNTKGEKLFNRAVSPRQPGSSIKPLAVYSAALQKSCEYANNGEYFPFNTNIYTKQGIYGWGNYITAASKVVDERCYVNGREWPQNATRYYSGNQTFRSALQKSINTCAVKILSQVGVEYSADLLKKYGLKSLVTDVNKPVNDLNLSALALGGMTHGVSPLEMASAYTTFPNNGERNKPVAYTKVVNAEGETILSADYKTEKVLDEGVAWIMTDLLKSVVYNGLGKPATVYGTQAGGKTGTTNDQYDIWFCGFTPKYSASLWIGTDDNKSLTSMSTPAAALWGKIMNQLPEATKGLYRDMPSNVVRIGGEYYTTGTY